MSREYKWFVRGGEFTAKDTGPVEDALREEFGIDSTFDEYNGRVDLYATGEFSIGGGQSAKEFSSKIRQAVWRACGRLVEVRVGAIYVEEPEDWFHGTKEEFDVNFVACPRCGKFHPIEDNVHGLCDDCAFEREDVDSRWCSVCKAWLDTDDLDETICAECRSDAAEYKVGER